MNGTSFTSQCVCVWLNVQIKPEFAYSILIDHALNGQLLFVQNCDITNVNFLA